MKYTIFGNCVLHPNTNNPDHLKYNWGAYFDNKHKGNIRWYMSYEQSNLQLAVQVMLCSKPNCVNIVQTNHIHRTAFIDNESPRSYNAKGNLIGTSCFADIETERLHERENDHLFTTSTWQNVYNTLNLDNKKSYLHPNNDKDKDFLQTWSKRNYIPQTKWELFLALALISKHAKAVGHDIRIIPRRSKDFATHNLSKLNKLHIEDIIKHVDMQKVFWYDVDNKQLGSDDWPKDDWQDIIDNKLQPWLDLHI